MGNALAGSKKTLYDLIHTIKKSLYRHGYTLLAVAWLFTISFLGDKYSGFLFGQERVKKQIEKKIAESEKHFEKMVSDSLMVNNLLSLDANESKASMNKEPIGFFIYTINDVGNPLLVYWNTNKFTVSPTDLKLKDGQHFLSYTNGYFEGIKKTITFNHQVLEIYGVIPLKWAFFTENRYLVNQFEGFELLDKMYDISKTGKGVKIYNSNGDALFSVVQKKGLDFAPYDPFTIYLRLGGIIALILVLYAMSNDIIAANGFKKGFAFLISSLFLLRFISYFSNFPFDHNLIPFFDPTYYASNALNPSLGDLFINSVLFFWLIWFYKAHEKNVHSKNSKPIKKWGVYYRLAIFFILGTFVSEILNSLVSDGKVSLDVAHFFSLNIYSLVAFLTIGLLIFGFHNLSQLIVKPIIENGISLTNQMLPIVIIGFFFLSITIGRQDTFANFVLLGWLLLYLYLLNYRNQDIYVPLLRTSFFVFWMIFFATSISLAIVYQTRSVEFQQRKKMVERLAEESDPGGQNLLSIAIANIDIKNISQDFQRFTQNLTAKYLRDSLINENFSGYLNKYETHIYVFDKNLTPQANEDSTSYEAIHAVVSYQGKRTYMPGLYTYQGSGNELSYLYEKPIVDLMDSSETIGYFFLVFKSKKYKSESLYPELFKQVQENTNNLNGDYSYAVYSGGQLVNRHNDYPFPLKISKNDITAFAFYSKEQNGFSELWFNGGYGKTVVMVHKNDYYLFPATLFAYIFCILVVFIFSSHIINTLVQSKFQQVPLRSFARMNIRAQIRATTLFISLFSFIVIGISTISYFTIRFKEASEERLSRTILVMANELQEKMQQVRNSIDLNDAPNYNDIGLTTDLEQKINEVSDVHNIDINLFSTKGTLLASTQPYIFSKQLLSEKMQPVAFGELSFNKVSRFIQTEHIGKLPFLSMYMPIFDQAGNVYAYLNIPYLNSQVELNQEISSFLATLINLNALVFLLAGGIAYLLSNKIVGSFAMIGNKMKEVGLGKVNEAIEWDKNDEIGVLVNEYNKMVKKLEQSAKALAQSEREGAWREMAKQVAHEIKNPLTPMKLSIQYLKNSVEQGSPKARELTLKMSATLIEQIDQLAKIAEDFSKFANIGNVKLELLDLNEILESVIFIHNQGRKCIKWEKQEGEYYIMGDKIHINRLFTNLLKNAMEVDREEGEPIEIVVKQQLRDNTAWIDIVDNGLGIPEKIRNNLFTPNFTTKSSGSGLGLAICKGILEKINGNISLTSEIGEPTTFTVSIPLTKPTEQVDGETI